LARPQRQAIHLGSSSAKLLRQVKDSLYRVVNTVSNRLNQGRFVELNDADCRFWTHVNGTDFTLVLIILRGARKSAFHRVRQISSYSTSTTPAVLMTYRIAEFDAGKAVVTRSCSFETVLVVQSNLQTPLMRQRGDKEL
jgi:hypothetical protein